MNDPGLDEPISHTSEKLENALKEDEELASEEQQAYLRPSRWWFAATGFPLIAATLGPVASSFNICALVVHWRVLIPPGEGANESHGIDVRDPKWLLAINGISLGTALISNLALLLNMARRVSFSIAQPITIVGWYMSSFLLIGDISGIVHVVKKPRERRALTQAYYYAIFAASLYFFIATLMAGTVYGAWRRHYSKEFKLTMSQRTLMLQTISFLIYMMAGAGVYAKIEGWKFLDSLFFTNYTLLTVGIGDYAPLTHLGRSLLFPFAVGGIVILGLVIGSIRSLALERGKAKLRSRMTEKKRQALVQRLDNTDDSKIHIAQDGKEEEHRRRLEFELMRSVQKATETRQKWMALLISGSAWLILWFVGAVVFYFAEHEQKWSYFDALYFAYTTLLTIGYGDLVPYSNSGKAFFVFWSLLAVPALTIVISNMGDTVVKLVKDATIWAGEFTILPGSNSAKDRLQQITGNLKPASVKHRIKAHSHQHRQLSQVPEDSYNSGGTVFEYHYMLVREFQEVLRQQKQEPLRKYAYEEWVRFLKLLGEDERLAFHHKKPAVKPENAEHLSRQGGNGGSAKWSWLGEKSPLMGEQTETEWLLEKLAGQLERGLHELHQAEGKRKGRGEET